MKKGEYVSMRTLKQTLPYLTVSLTILYIFMRIYKSYYNPFAFPGIEERISLILVPCLFLTFIFYFPFQRIANLLKVTLNILREKVSMPTFIQKRVRFDVFKLKFTEKFDLRKIISSESHQKALIKYLFLVFLVIIALLELEPISKYLSFLTGFKNHLFVLTIVFGVVTFWQNREVIDEVEEEITEEQKQEEQGEKRKEEFHKKYPAINKIPILRNTVKWMYKEGWWYSIIIVFIILISVLLRFWNLGTLGFHGDEFFHQLPADGIKQSLLPTLPNRVLYIRGPLTSYLSALGTFVFFGELGYRILPTLLSFILMLISFYLVKKYFNKKIALIYLLFVGTEFWIIESSRYLRFYQIQIFLTMIIILLLLDENIFSSLKRTFFLFILFFISMLESQHGFFLIPLIFLRIFYNNIISSKNIKIWKFKKILLLVAIFFIPIFIVYSINFTSSTLCSLPNVGNQDTGLFEKVLNLMVNNINPNILDTYFLKALYYAYPILVLFFIVFFSTFINYKKIDKKKAWIVFSFILLLGILSILKAKDQQRILLPTLGPFFLVISFFIYEFFKEKSKNFKIGIIILLLIFPIFIQSFGIPFRNYGDEFDKIKLMSNAEPYYPDYKTTSNFLDNNIESNDLLLINGPSIASYWSYLNLKDKTNVAGIQLYRRGVKMVNNEYYDIYTDIPVYYSTQHIIDKIENHEKGQVYILFSYSSSQVDSLILDKVITWSHLDNNLRDYIIKHSELVYNGRDNASRVYLFRI